MVSAPGQASLCRRGASSSPSLSSDGLSGLSGGSEQLGWQIPGQGVGPPGPLRRSQWAGGWAGERVGVCEHTRPRLRRGCWCEHLTPHLLHFRSPHALSGTPSPPGLGYGSHLALPGLGTWCGRCGEGPSRLLWGPRPRPTPPRPVLGHCLKCSGSVGRGTGNSFPRAQMCRGEAGVGEQGSGRALGSSFAPDVLGPPLGPAQCVPPVPSEEGVPLAATGPG